MAKLNDKKLHARLSDGEQKSEALANEHLLLLKEVKDQLEKNNQLTQTGNEISTRISSVLKLEWFRQLGEELKNFMRRIFIMNIATYRAVIDIQSGLPSQLERSLYQEPFILEDAIGRVAPVHMQFVSSWEAFDSVLDLRFRDMQGHKKVQNKEYVLQENATRREIDRSRPWAASFLPGQKVVMSILFDDSGISTSLCPRCQSTSEKPQDTDIKWSVAPKRPATHSYLTNVSSAGCGMWYRRITEVKDVDPPLPFTRLSPRAPERVSVAFGRSAFSGEILNTTAPDQFLQFSPAKKRKREDSQKDDLALFKRVRLVTRKTRLRRTKLASKPFSRSPFTRHAAIKTAFEQSPVEPPQQMFSKALETLPKMFDTPAPAESREHLGNSSSDDEEIESQRTHCDDGHEEEPSLHIAAFNGILWRVEQLLNDGVSIETTDSTRATALHIAAIHGNEQVVQQLLGKGANLEATDINMRTPIHHAASYKRNTVVQLLLDEGANLEAIDKGWDTPLHMAVRYRNEAIILLLLERGASLEAINKGGETPLHMAVRHRNEAITLLLLDKGADPEARNREGRTVFHRAASMEEKSIMRLLLDKGANLERRYAGGYTALQRATLRGSEDLVRLLLDWEASITTETDTGESLLHSAASSGNTTIIQLLLDNGANIEAEDKFGLTVLYKAVWFSKHAAVCLLLDKGANLNPATNAGTTVLHYAATAARNDTTEMVENEAIIELLLGKGLNMEARDVSGCTALHIAARFGNQDAARIFLDRGANLEAISEDRETALHRAAQGGNKAMVEFLLNRGANLEAREKWGRTAFDLAFSNGKEDVVQVFRSKKREEGGGPRG